MSAETAASVEAVGRRRRRGLRQEADEDVDAEEAPASAFDGVLDSEPEDSLADEPLEEEPFDDPESFDEAEPFDEPESLDEADSFSLRRPAALAPWSFL